MATFCPVVILLVQDQPKLETRVGAADVDAASFAKRRRFVETRVFVSVEYRPDLVAFLERILFSPTVPVESQDSGALDGFFRDGIGNAHGGDYFDGDESASIDAAERAKIGGFRPLSLAEQNEPPLRLPPMRATPQVRRGAFGGPSSTRQE